MRRTSSSRPPCTASCFLNKVGRWKPFTFWTRSWVFFPYFQIKCSKNEENCCVFLFLNGAPERPSALHLAVFGPSLLQPFELNIVHILPEVSVQSQSLKPSLSQSIVLYLAPLCLHHQVGLWQPVNQEKLIYIYQYQLTWIWYWTVLKVHYIKTQKIDVL